MTRVIRARSWALVSLTLAACGGGAPLPPTTRSETASSGDETPHAGSAEADPLDYVDQGVGYIRRGQFELAIQRGFDPALALYERSSAEGERVYASRTGGAAALLLLMTAASEHESAVVTGAAWPDTLYLKAFCLVELGRVDEAEETLRRALELMPGDVVYSCELGHIMQGRRQWDEALALFRAALENVAQLEQSDAFAHTAEQPDGPLLFERTLAQWRLRAMRGIGFTQIELGQLNEAEDTFRRVLQLDPHDTRAPGELEYIQRQRQERWTNPR